MGITICWWKNGDDRGRAPKRRLEAEERLHQIAWRRAEVTPAHLESAKQLMEEAQRQG